MLTPRYLSGLGMDASLRWHDGVALDLIPIPL
jgi:hypothetical protein